MAIELARDVTGEGRLLVLVHEVTEDLRAWDPVVEPLAQSHRVLRVDLRGHGRSPVVGPYDMQTLVADVHAAIEAAAPAGAPQPAEPPLIVGHAFGGVIATLYGAHYPARGVVTVAQRLDLTHLRDAASGYEAMLRSSLFPQLIREVYGSRYRGLAPEEILRLDAIRHPRQAVVLAMWTLILDYPGEALEAVVRQAFSAPDLAVLAIHGDPLPPDYGAWIRTLLPRAEVEVWEGAGYYPHLLMPDRFVSAVRGFDAGL